jgi:uncharacterized protein (TIGR02996 family)
MRDERVPVGVVVGERERERAIEPIGVAPAMRALLARLGELAGNILIQAEPGGGARTIAEAIHTRLRPECPVVFVECAEVPAALIESALFGHERFSCFGGGGLQINKGAFELADGGTVVLVEIAALPPEVHGRVLRVLESRQVRRIGGNRSLPATAAVIATTRHDPEALVASARLRPELRAAFGEVVNIPPLRERREDIGPLLRQFLGMHPLPLDVERRLAALPWPGNVTQLEHAARALAVGGDPDAVIAEQELLETITAEPDDLGTRMVYGDLLLSRGDPRGELIHLQCRLAGARTERIRPEAQRFDAGAPSGLTPQERKQLRASERALLAAHEAAWLEPVLAHPHVSAAQLRRGFVEVVTASIEIARRLDTLFRVAPALIELELDPIDAPHPVDASTLAHAPDLARLRALRLHAQGSADEVVEMIAGCPHLGGLRELVLAGTERGSLPPAMLEIGAGAARMLATAPHLERVSTLVLERCRLRATAIRALVGPRARWRPAQLVLRDCELDAAAAAALERPAGATAIKYHAPRGRRRGPASPQDEPAVRDPNKA